MTQALKLIFVLFGNKIVFLSKVHLHQPFLSKTCPMGFVSLIIINIVDTVILIFIINICIAMLFVVILKGVLYGQIISLKHLLLGVCWLTFCYMSFRRNFFPKFCLSFNPMLNASWNDIIQFRIFGDGGGRRKFQGKLLGLDQVHAILKIHTYRKTYPKPKQKKKC